MISNYIIGLVLVIVIIVPVILLNRGKRAKSKAVQAKLQELSGKSIFDEEEMWNNCHIALDKTSKQVYFVRHENDNCVAKSVLLSDCTQCKVSTSSSLGASGNTVDVVELVFIPKDKQGEKTSFVCFNADVDGFTLNGELQIAERWKSLCNKYIK